MNSNKTQLFEAHKKYNENETLRKQKQRENLLKNQRKHVENENLKLRNDINKLESSIKIEELNNKPDNSIKSENDVLSVEENNDMHIDMNNIPNQLTDINGIVDIIGTWRERSKIEKKKDNSCMFVCRCNFLYTRS